MVMPFTSCLVFERSNIVVIMRPNDHEASMSMQREKKSRRTKYMWEKQHEYEENTPAGEHAVAEQVRAPAHWSSTRQYIRFISCHATNKPCHASHPC